MIEAYSFGSMRVLGQTYHNDLKIIRNQVIGDWWRLQGHVLSTEDIADVLESSVEILVVGTGAYGGLKVPPEVSRATSQRGIGLTSVPTDEAVAIFNRFHSEGRQAAGAFHLTC